MQAVGVIVLSGEHSSALSCNLYGDGKVQVWGYGEGQEAEAPSSTQEALWKRVLLSCIGSGADVPHSRLIWKTRGGKHELITFRMSFHAFEFKIRLFIL